MKSRLQKAIEVQAEESAAQGVWCGGVTTTLAVFDDHGFDVVYDGSEPVDGRTAIVYDPATGEAEVFEQHWHGGENSGSWWWEVKGS